MASSSLTNHCRTEGLRVHTTLPSPKPHAILAGRAQAGAAVAGRPPATSSDSSITGRRQSGHSGRRSSHLPMHAAWNPCPHPGSLRTAAAGSPASSSEIPPISPATSSDRHTAHSGVVVAGDDDASTAIAAPSLPLSSSQEDDDDARARTAAAAAVAQAAMVTAAIPLAWEWGFACACLSVCGRMYVCVGARRGGRRGRINDASEGRE